MIDKITRNFRIAFHNNALSIVSVAIVYHAKKQNPSIDIKTREFIIHSYFSFFEGLFHGKTLKQIINDYDRYQ